MRQAIITKYLCPTNVRGSRVLAKTAAGSKKIEWDSELNPEQNHKRAAEVYAEMMQWAGKWHGGCLPDGSYCFVNETNLPGDWFAISRKTV